jgi:hypothetical protein
MSRTADTRQRCRQRGAALLILLVILTAGALYAMLSSLNEATATAPLQRKEQNAEVLRQAKEALIAYALQRGNPHGPGHLPCPDRNNDGISDGIACGTATTRVGRLPWNSLGLPDLRDASGERLWYAVSRCFLERNLGTDVPAPCSEGYRVNSDVPGALQVGGLAPASGIVAVILAPGSRVGSQGRSGPGPDPKTATCSIGADESCRVANYLEGDNNTPDDVFIAVTACEGGDPAKCPFGATNDQLVVITHEEFFRAVEEEVRRRVERELVPALISDYSEPWRNALGLAAGAVVMPFAAPFIDAAAMPTDPTRAQDLYRGAAGLTAGLLPLTQDTAFLTWIVGGAGAVVVETRSPPGVGPWGSPTITTPPTDTPGSLTFTVDHGGTAAEYRVSGRLRNVGSTFALPFAPPINPGFASSSSVVQSFAASGDLDVAFTFTVAAAPLGPGAGPLTFSIAKPQFPTWSGMASPLQWFFENRWYRHVLYAVSPGIVPAPSPGFAGTCMAPPGLPACVVVESPRPTDERTDARFALVLAGRHIRPTPRTWSPTDYFEGLNCELLKSTMAPPPAEPCNPLLATVPGVQKLSRNLRGPQFNDKVIAQ